MKRSVLVVGGGVSGLTVAYELLSRAERLDFELDVLCLEAADRPGGNVRTIVDSGFLCEWGPTGFLDNAPATLTLVRRLGLESRLVRARPEAAARFVFRKGGLRPLPTGPLAFLSSRLLSPWGKLRLLAEPLGAAVRDARDESILEFGSRRIGREATRVLIDAMVGGVYAGDIERLSLPATFPRMREMEQRHGSLFRALLARRREARADGATPSGGPAGPGGTLSSFREGLQELVEALARELGPRLRSGCRVTTVADLGRRGYRVLADEGPPLEVDAVVLACPAWRAASQVEALDGQISEAMAAIESAPLVVAHCGFDDNALGELPEGFGFLVPRIEGLRSLGTLWTSRFFEGRAPADRRLMTTMLGGAHDPAVVDLDDAAILEIVRHDLERTMGILARPYFVRLFRHARGIPQYTLGHLERVATIERRLRDHPGLAICGNSYRGISVNACIEEAPRIAESLIEHLSIAT